MPSTEKSELQTTLYATVDFILAFVSVGFVVGFGVAIANEALGSPLTRGVLEWFVGAVAFAGSYPLVTGRRSLSRFLEFAFTLIVTFVALALLASIPLLLVGGIPTDSFSSRALQLALAVGAYVLALVDVYHTPLIR